MEYQSGVTELFERYNSRGQRGYIDGRGEGPSGDMPDGTRRYTVGGSEQQQAACPVERTFMRMEFIVFSWTVGCFECSFTASMSRLSSVVNVVA